jgi:SAM-dependent methyltransferase
VERSTDPALPPDLFERVDDSDDALFYTSPRLVAHIDEATIAALTQYYSEVLAPGARVLDLMSSWISHLPAVAFSHVAGLGMNYEELARNPRLDARVVHDLNRAPVLPFAAASFDAVLIAVSVQYLTKPIEVFAEISRVLAPAGRVIVAMSHRCFPTKAVRAFHLLPPAERVRLVGAYLDLAGCFDDISFVDRSPPNADPLWIVTARRATEESR